MSEGPGRPELDSPLDRLLGTEWVDDDPAHARVRLPVRDELMQPAGLVHGGVLCTLVESICSRATALAAHGQGMTAMGQSQSISYLRPVIEGTIQVEARARHRGRSSWVWAAEVTDGEGRLCALAQVTVALRTRA